MTPPYLSVEATAGASFKCPIHVFVFDKIYIRYGDITRQISICDSQFYGDRTSSIVETFKLSADDRYLRLTANKDAGESNLQLSDPIPYLSV